MIFDKKNGVGVGSWGIFLGRQVASVAVTLKDSILVSIFNEHELSDHHNNASRHSQYHELQL